MHGWPSTARVLQEVGISLHAWRQLPLPSLPARKQQRRYGGEAEGDSIE